MSFEGELPRDLTLHAPSCAQERVESRAAGWEVVAARGIENLDRALDENPHTLDFERIQPGADSERCTRRGAVGGIEIGIGGVKTRTLSVEGAQAALELQYLSEPPHACEVERLHIDVVVILRGGVIGDTEPIGSLGQRQPPGEQTRRSGSGW